MRSCDCHSRFYFGVNLNQSSLLIKAVVFLAICFGGFSLVGVSGGSPVAMHLVVLPFVFALALLGHGLKPMGAILKSRQFLTVLPFLGVSLFLAPLGVLFGFGPVYLVAASYFAFVVPIVLIYLGYIGWSRLEYGRGLCSVVAISILFNFMMSASQMLLVYFGIELFAISEFLNWQYEIKAQLSDSYDIRGRATGVFINPNDFGFWSIIMLGYVWLYFRHPFLKSVFILLLLFCLFSSNSRGALAAFLLTTVLVWFSYFKNWFFRGVRNWMFWGLFVFAFYVSFVLLNAFSGFSEQSYTFLNRFSAMWDTITGVSTDENLSGRYSAWSSATQVINDYPFGTFVPPETLLHVAADNQYVYVFLQGGILYLAAYVWLLLRGALYFYQNNLKYLFWCNWCILFYGLTAYPMNSYSMLMYWIFFGGAIFASYARGRKNNA